MKIALVSPTFLPAVGGAQFVVHCLAQEWAKQGHEVRVFNWVTDEVAHPDALYSVRRFRLLRGAPRFGYHRFPFSWYTVSDLNRLMREFERSSGIDVGDGVGVGHPPQRFRRRARFVRRRDVAGW